MGVTVRCFVFVCCINKAKHSGKHNKHLPELRQVLPRSLQKSVCSSVFRAAICCLSSVAMKPAILGLLMVLYAGAYLAQDINDQSKGCTDEEGCVEAPQGAGEPLHRVARQANECSKTPEDCKELNGICIRNGDTCIGDTQKQLCQDEDCTCCKKHVCAQTPNKCLKNNGVCINLMDECAGSRNDTLCNNGHCTCCQKHVCQNTPNKCLQNNGVCINLMDECAGTRNDTLCNNRHCTCCQKHVCQNTPKKCSEKNGVCINLMDECAGTKNDTLCNNRHCTCCIPA
ncbi:protein psiQ-like [Penaeus chinensis]|uniref:protein psiQ-like n=1 Tax=Penaeus chinensis TaxID=139456 RepID=UPI001FB76F48|nr:protein psiQ-like [Penaeus chinensis]